MRNIMNESLPETPKEIWNNPEKDFSNDQSGRFENNSRELAKKMSFVPLRNNLAFNNKVKSMSGNGSSKMASMDKVMGAKLKGFKTKKFIW